MKSESQATLKATGMIVLSSVGFGSLSTLAVLTGKSGLPLLPAMVWRYLLAALLLAAILRSTKLRSLERKRALQLMLVGAAGQSAITYLSLYALNFLPVGPLAFLFYTYPAWVTIIAAVLGRDALTIPKLIALVMAMTGIAVMVGRPSVSGLSTFGVTLALGIAFLYALYLPVLHKVQEGVSALVSSFYLISGVFISFFFSSLVTGTFRFPESSAQWAFVGMLALFATVIAFATLVAGLRVLGPVKTSIIATIEPFFTLILGVILLGEAITRNTVAGGLLIAAAVVLLQVTSRKPVPAEVVT